MLKQAIRFIVEFCGRLALGILMSAVFILVVIGSVAVFFWIVYVVQPWPLSLRQGPDTEYAREHFVKLAGEAPANSVSKIYYYTDNAFSELLRFQTTNLGILRILVHDYELEPDPYEARDSGPSWWTKDRDKESIESFSRFENHGTWRLWYDRETGTVWFSADH